MEKTYTALPQSRTATHALANLGNMMACIHAAVHSLVQENKMSNGEDTPISKMSDKQGPVRRMIRAPTHTLYARPRIDLMLCGKFPRP